MFLLMLGVFLTPNNSMLSATSTGKIPVPENAAYVGAYVGLETNSTWAWGPGGHFEKTVKDFEKTIGKRLAINHVYNSWDELNNWNSCHWYWCLSQMLQTIVADGSIPMVSWKPVKWNPATRSMDLPIKLQDIIDGHYDDYVQDWARNSKSFQYPMFLRFGWEMTYGGDSWSGPQNFGRYGNQSWDQVDDLYKYYGDPRKPDGPERYVDTWKHIHDIFQRLQVNNVEWVWSPGVGASPDLKWNSVENYYPGDDYVDWVGAHVFNFGYYETKSGILEGWRAFDWIFENKQAMKVYKGYTSKPFMIAEISSSSESAPGVLAYGKKAQWITDAINQIEIKYRNVKAVIWFSEDKSAEGERDWRVDYPANVLKAFNEGISDPYFLDHIPFEYRPLTTTTVQPITLQTSTTATTASMTLSREPVAPNRYELYLMSAVGIVALAVGILVKVRRASKSQEPH
jgi:hypothetical protein